ncbi:unnamed protein product [Auanema sp. JU1783]|nr:unnamed protein product [Auanema sp. JU1783]
MSWPNGNMMCDVMPTINEDGIDVNTEEHPSSHDNNIEQLMVNMLEDRDKLQEQLEQYKKTIETKDHQAKLWEKEKESLLRQINLHTQSLPPELQILTRELIQLRESLLEKDEEIVELKAERNNTRLLLEHLECLVSRHERSLRITVMKRQQQNQAGVSSEVEVLKALKSLFEHHKALDEKVRERLRVAMERVATLEDDLTIKNDENIQLKSRIAVYVSEAGDSQKLDEKTNGGTGIDSARMLDMQEACERLRSELQNAVKQTEDLFRRNADLEEELSNSQEQHQSVQDQIVKFKNQLQEAEAQKVEQQRRFDSLENRYMSSQREFTCIRDLNDKLEHELANKDASVRLNEEKVYSLQNKLELAEKQLAQSLKKAESLPTVEAELQQRLKALSVAEQKQLSAEERIHAVEKQMSEKAGELDRALQREQMNEEHNQRLSSTVDKLLSESNDRLQLHLKERMQALDDKNRLTQELENSKKLMHQAERAVDRFQRENDSLKADVDHLRRQLYSNRTAQFTSKINSSHCNLISGQNSCYTPGDLITTYLSSNEPPAASYATVGARRARKGRVALQNDATKVQTLNEEEWDRLQQAHVLANVQQAFSSSPSLIDMNTSVHQNDPLAGADNTMLASMLQDHLDAINSEINMINQEKELAEKAVDQYEKQVRLGYYSDHSPTRSSPQTYSSEFAGNKYFTLPNRSYQDNDYPQSAVLDDSILSLKNNASLYRLKKNQLNAQNDIDRLSPVSSVASSSNGYTTKKKRSTSSSGFRTLGRLFTKKKSQTILGNEGSFSDSEITSGMDGRFEKANECDRRNKKKHELLEEALKARTPFALWNGPTVVAWLELWVGMPAWYVAACRANVKSGAIMSALSDQEIQREIGISNPLHRLKLRLAIQEMVSLTSPSAPRSTRENFALRDMNHEWVGNEWLPSLGLGQYRSAFMECLLDARMLEHLSKRDLRSHLHMIDSFHRASLQYGILCLKKLNYDKKVLQSRRQACEELNTDLLVWSNERVQRWVEEIGLGSYAPNLHESGIHGALIALDETFDASTFAVSLQINPLDKQVRKVLESNFIQLIRDFRNNGGYNL